MAWMKVTHACGHDRWVQVYGPVAQRAQKVEWMGRRPCPDCERAAEEAEAKADAEQRGLPALQGTEKQVAWANVLRYRTLQNLERWWQERTSGAKAVGLEAREQFEAAVKAVAAHDDATWWIDRRDWSPTAIVREALEAAQA